MSCSHPTSLHLAFGTMKTAGTTNVEPTIAAQPDDEDAIGVARHYVR